MPMKHIVQKNWVTGSGSQIDFYDLLNILKIHVSKGAKIFIGTDSFNSNSLTCFASAVCLHGGEMESRYFFFKDYKQKNLYSQLVSRITEETTRSINIANLLIKEYKFNLSNIELHLDISPKSKNEKTSKYSEMLSGYVQGYGLGYQLKPNAWASQSVADRHSK